MALIYCRECGKQISDQAFTCPYCGCPMGNYNPNAQVLSCDPNRSKYDWLTTLLLCFFLGCLDRFCDEVEGQNPINEQECKNYSFLV